MRIVQFVLGVSVSLTLGYLVAVYVTGWLVVLVEQLQ